MISLQDPSLLKQHAFINGLWLPAQSGETLPVINPANGKTLGTVPNCDASDTRMAIEAAERALPQWSRLTAHERAARLRVWHDLMIEHADDLALIMTLEQGKPLAESRGEILYGASFVQWFAEEGIRAYGETIPAQQPGRRIIVRKMPVGVCAAITPWNFPNAMITRKLAPALAAGCTVIVKPSELTPFSALALAVLAERAGIPAGVINIVTGMPQAIGGELTGNPTVRKLTFTGSTNVGKLLLRQCADTVKRVSMELGGNAPVIVFDDADLDKAVTGVMLSKFRNSGQTCVCANRIYVQAGIYDVFLEKLKTTVNQLRLGVGVDKGVTVGPLINQAAVAKVSAHVSDAVAKGAILVTGGASSELGEQFFLPTILSGATDSMRIAAEETFGPVAALFKFSTEEEVIRRANNTPYGLAGYLFSRDLARVFRVGEALEYGMVGINTGVISSAVAPFGGVKESGLGREGSHHGIDEFLESQTLHLDVD
ncbi:NAD-dependent succinate-semialdehyde dehydrogenase [Pandoraea sp. ISTKB]|uniref:NAD-dependent succinate-semialdehyde dehydrogenase n=1 Tax=Pandoraea sp. ISTKB TaxID=1586708 RepID=UPI0008466987|nr:NAD-dependent succinate-semialdehyde dehydrogenase [Pandoraea sp. ISTKB]ODP31086.1 succinate-semialdehyde dehydrogenase (NADP(+)) [Pandoraea sp. ISTKB]